MMRKTVLITGTSTGLGSSLALQAAQAGHRVYASMRDLKRRAALDRQAAELGVDIEVVELDVQDTDSVNRAIDEVLADAGGIDTLINNAGAGFVRSTEQASEADIQWVMDVNFMGVVRCTKAVLPHMRTQRAGHVINISSVGGLVGQPFNEIYCAAKFAVEGYTESLASYITPSFGVNFTSVEPGGITSEFASNVMKHIESNGGMLDDEYLPILQKYIGGARNRSGGQDIYQSCDEVAKVVIDCVNADDPPIRTRTSPWSEAFTALKTGLDPDGRKQQALVIEQFLS